MAFRPSASTLSCALACALSLATGSARAQSCGDANNSGGVDVIDAANVLRAAVSLPSTCATAFNLCDVDASGAIDVIDAANVLRAAVALPANLGCTGGGATAQAEQAVQDVLPLLTTGFSLVPQISLPLAVAAADDVEECPAGGTRTKFMPGPATIRVTLDQCRFSDPQLGRFQFDGAIVVALQIAQVAVNFSVTDLDSNRVVEFDGVVPGITPLLGGGFVANGGPITVTTPQGDFELNFDDLTVDKDGHVVSGAGTIEDTSDNFDLLSVAFTVTSPTTADILATFDDLSTASFLLNLETGKLTPVS